ncbi:MAG: hypothetical protein AAFR31_18260 [Cyanobacteria bacterium J06627_8]
MNHQPPQQTWVYTTPPPSAVPNTPIYPPQTHLGIHLDHPNEKPETQDLLPQEVLRAWGILGVLTVFLLLGFLIGVIYERTNESTSRRAMNSISTVSRSLPNESTDLKKVRQHIM